MSGCAINVPQMDQSSGLHSDEGVPIQKGCSRSQLPSATQLHGLRICTVTQPSTPLCDVLDTKPWQQSSHHLHHHVDHPLTSGSPSHRLKAHHRTPNGRHQPKATLSSILSDAKFGQANCRANALGLNLGCTLPDSYVQVGIVCQSTKRARRTEEEKPVSCDQCTTQSHQRSVDEVQESHRNSKRSRKG